MRGGAGGGADRAGGGDVVTTDLAVPIESGLTAPCGVASVVTCGCAVVVFFAATAARESCWALLCACRIESRMALRTRAMESRCER